MQMSERAALTFDGCRTPATFLALSDTHYPISDTRPMTVPTNGG